MKIFITGASGAIGSALIPKLVAAGHEITALARSSSSADKVTSLGARAINGDITDLDICANASRDVDAVIHLAFDHQMAFSGDFAGACAKDRNAIAAISDALSTDTGANGNGKLFVFCSGTLGLQGDSESDDSERNEHLPRFKSTDLAFTYASKGVRVVQIRLAPITFGVEKPHDFIGMQIAQGKKDGHVAYVQDSVWPACTVDDSADLFVKVVASESTSGTLDNPCTLHGIAEEGVETSKVARVIAGKLGVEAKAVGRDEAMGLGFIGMLMCIAKPAKSDWTREAMGWRPAGKGLLAQLEEYDYA